MRTVNICRFFLMLTLATLNLAAKTKHASASHSKSTKVSSSHGSHESKAKPSSAHGSHETTKKEKSGSHTLKKSKSTTNLHKSDSTHNKSTEHHKTEKDATHAHDSKSKSGGHHLHIDTKKLLGKTKKIGKSSLHVANDLAHDSGLNFDPKMGSCLDAIPKITEGLEEITAGKINAAELVKKGTHLLFDFKACAHLLTSHANLGAECKTQISESFGSLKKGVSHLKSKVLHKIPHPHIGHHKKNDSKGKEKAEEKGSPFLETILKVKGITEKCGGKKEGGQEGPEATNASSGSSAPEEGETSGSSASEDGETSGSSAEDEVEAFIF